MELSRVIIQWYKNQMFRNKIRIIFIPLTVIPLVIFGFYSYKISTEIIIDKTRTNIANNSLVMVNEVDNVMKDTENAANTLMINLNKILSSTLNDSIDRSIPLTIERRITTELNWAILMFPQIESAMFIDSQGNIMTTDTLLGVSLENGNIENVVRATNKNGIAITWFPMERRSGLSRSSYPVLTLGKGIHDIYTGDKLGDLILNINEQTFSKIFNKAGPMTTGKYYIVNDNGVVVSSNEYNELLTPLKDNRIKSWLDNEAPVDFIYVNGTKTLFTKSPIRFFGWQMISETPAKEIYADFNKLLIPMIIIGLICVLITLIGSNVLSKVIANPIIDLKSKMILFNDESLSQPLKVDSTDEIGIFTKGFNTMLSRIRGLIERIKIEENKRREYELALIQAQIKPHFLYNTLDTIYTLERLGESDKAQVATKALADFYRLALSNGNEEIPIREELKNLEAYLVIQKFRYEHVFEYDIQVDETIKDCLILKLTLQPLVENSIYHGLKMKGSLGKISIKGYTHGGKVVIEVRDDGIGISPEKLAEINDEFVKGKRKDSFALGNVNDRIKLYYGEEYGLQIQSEVNVGTSITITLSDLKKEGLIEC